MKQVAAEWLQAGAEIICTATYQVTIDVLASEFKLSHKEAEQHVQNHCNQLHKAAEDYWHDFSQLSNNTNGVISEVNTSLAHRKPILALSLGPLSAIHPDYDEFSSHYGDDITIDKLQNFHGDRITSFLGTGGSSSVIAFETIGVISEAIAICQVMKNHDFPFWLSFQCRDPNSLASGNPLVESICTVLKECSQHKRLVAIGVNCVCVSMVDALIQNIRKEVDSFMINCKDPWRVDVIAYPNSGEVWSDRSWDWSKSDNATVSGPLMEDDWANTVFSSQANIIGGCCRTNPTHIAALRRASVGCITAAE